MAEELISISKSRLRELEELEASIPQLVEKAIKEFKSNSLKRLHEKDKENPKAVAERAKRYLEKNREAINERRRLKRQQKKNQNETVIQISPQPPKIYDYSKPAAKTITFD